jgi:predicted nucleic acid-binding protein
MVLVDTSVWIDHFRNTNSRFAGLLISEEVSCHTLTYHVIDIYSNVPQ